MAIKSLLALTHVVSDCRITQILKTNTILRKKRRYECVLNSRQRNSHSTFHTTVPKMHIFHKSVLSDPIHCRRAVVAWRCIIISFSPIVANKGPRSGVPSPGSLLQRGIPSRLQAFSEPRRRRAWLTQWLRTLSNFTLLTDLRVQTLNSSMRAQKNRMATWVIRARIGTSVKTWDKFTCVYRYMCTQFGDG